MKKLVLLPVSTLPALNNTQKGGRRLPFGGGQCKDWPILGDKSANAGKMRVNAVRRGPAQSIEFVLHGGEKTFAVTNADGYLFVADPDLAFADMFDLADGHDIGAVGTDEFPGR